MSSHGFKNADFPMSDEGRTYHLEVKRGEVANRVLTVGDTARAQYLKRFMDVIYHERTAPRHFTIITGARHGVPVSIIVSLMGYPNTDFVVREARAVVDGTLVFVRFGTCGTPNEHCHIGDLACGRESRGIIRNPDAFRQPAGEHQEYYHITLPVPSDPELYAHMTRELRAKLGDRVKEGTKLSGCSFFSSQGRPGTHFEDHNENMLDRIHTEVPEAVGIEMETFHLYDLASLSRGTVKAMGTAMIIAERNVKAFVTPAQKEAMQAELGSAVFESLVSFPIAEDQLMHDPECVWNVKQ